MKNNLIYFCCFLLTTACSMKPREVPKPSNLISKDTFALILEELLIIEQQIGYKVPATNSQFQSIAKNSGDYILRNYNVNYDEFDSSFIYYNANQQEMKGIYDSIIQKLTLKSNAL